MNIKPLRRSTMVLAILLGLITPGCQQTSRDLALDEAQAREACKTALEAWQSSKKPQDLKPDIIASDYAWNSGSELVSFDFLPGERSDGTNLHIPVQLTLKDGKGREASSKATYVVGTAPVVTVIRD